MTPVQMLQMTGTPTLDMTRGWSAGGKAWEEDTWADLHIGGLDFHAALPCARCKASPDCLLFMPLLDLQASHLLHCTILSHLTPGIPVPLDRGAPQ